jgi:Rab family protein
MKSIRFQGKSFKLQFWDSAGQEKYKSLIPNYIRGSSIIFAVFDITGKF